MTREYPDRPFIGVGAVIGAGLMGSGIAQVSAALDTTLGGDCIGNPFEVLVENEPNGPAGDRITAERACLMPSARPR